MTDLETQKQNRIKLASTRQRQAAAPESSVWVEASAGTGKTKVLSDRVLRMLLNGAAPHKILCLTYTKAAAVEMNARIAARLSRWAIAEDDELNKQLKNLLGRELNENDEPLRQTARRLFAIMLDTPGGMKIQTIHSFCQEILKRFPLEARVSPYFEVMDERRAGEILDELKKRLLLKIKEDPDSPEAEAMLYLTEHTSEFAFPDILNAIASSRGKISRIFNQYQSVDKLLHVTAARLNLTENSTEQSILAEFWDGLKKEQIKHWTEVLPTGSKTDKDKGIFLENLLSSDDKNIFFKDYMALFLNKEEEIRKTIFTTAVFKSGINESETTEEALRVQNTCLSLRRVRLWEATKSVIRLAKELIFGYDFYKQTHALMDYEDLILLTRRLLESPGTASWVLYKLDGGIDNILIDEAQDTSPNQWAVIRALTADFFSGETSSSANRTIFAVGDRKQSIYSFQGADPEEFESMRLHFQKQTAASSPLQDVRMDVSFRSTGAVLDFVNHLFSKTAVKQGVVREETDINHTPARIGEAGKVELWPLLVPEEDENPDIWKPPVERKTSGTTSSRLARKIALRIRQMVSNHELLVSQNRPIRYRDILILVQRRNAFVEELVRACKQIGVEIAGVDKISLLDQIAVQDMIALGKFLLLPDDELNLAGLLKSPLFDLTDDDIFTLCHNRGKQNLWQRLQQNEKYDKCTQTLRSLLNKADIIRPFELYTHVLSSLDGRKKLLTRLGSEAADGLDEFINLTLNFEQEHTPSLQKFIAWIENDEVEIKRELEQSNIDAVRIMTVHGSKGLQAPIVILPDTVRMKTMRREAGLLTDDLLYYPLGSDYYEEHCTKIKDKQNKLAAEEYRRLLYVALTRAEDRLCICGWQGKTKAADECWYKLCEQSLKEISQVQDENIVCLETPQQTPPPVSEGKNNLHTAAPLPEWATTSAPIASALEKPLAPSHLEEEDEETALSPLASQGNNPYRRGRIMHKLLQFLPGHKKSDYPKLIEDYLTHNAPGLTVNEKTYILKKIDFLLSMPAFQNFFSDNSIAEVPLMGKVNGKIISGQIDRLIIEKDKITIIDFKTNRPAARNPEEIPTGYLKQMEAYKALVQKIYPDKQISCGILWTDTTQFMLIDKQISL